MTESKLNASDYLQTHERYRPPLHRGPGKLIRILVVLAVVPYFIAVGMWLVSLI